nr:MAG TPA: distal tail protein [Caudoviricetes sp.]
MAIKDYLVVDMAKPANTFVNLTDYFQGRVGDAEAYCKLWIKYASRPIDMTDKKLRFEGNDPNNTPFIDAGRFDAGDDGDVQLGMITFYFPKGFFQVEGKWQHAFFKLQTNDGKDISTADLTLNVLPNNVEMGIGIHPFESDLEKTKAQINQALREMNAQQLLNQLDSMKTTVGAYTDLIEQHAVLNKPQTVDLVSGIVNPFKTDLTNKMSSLSSSLNGQMSTLKSSVNSQFDKTKWHFEQYGATMLNGCGGWTSGFIFYNDVVLIGRIQGWVKFPQNSWKNINFATNPLASRVKFDNSTIGEIVGVFPDSSNGRVTMFCNMVGDDFGQLGLWELWNNDTNYVHDDSASMMFSMPFASPVGVLK